MNSRKRTINISLTYGTPESKWCHRCQTGAGFEAQVYRLSDDGPVNVGTLSGCSRCATDDTNTTPTKEN